MKPKSYYLGLALLAAGALIGAGLGVRKVAHYHYDHSHTWISNLKQQVGDTNTDYLPAHVTFSCPAYVEHYPVIDAKGNVSLGPDGKPLMVPKITVGPAYLTYWLDLDVESGQFRVYGMQKVGPEFRCPKS